MRAALAFCVVLGLNAGDTRAQDRGPVTNLPLPRFVSLKAAEGYARHGPGKTHRIDWVYQHRNQPLEITAEYGHWRRVRDQDGLGGWMHYSLLSGVRTVLVSAEIADMRRQPNAQADLSAQAEGGVVAKLGKCALDWCQVYAGRQKGWVLKTQIWGVRPDEVRD